MRVEKRDGYRVIVGGPVPPQADAITLGRTVIVRERAAASRGLMAHELVHVRQFIEMGAVRFALRYVGSYLRFRLNGHGHMAAYRRIPLEVEASWQSRVQQLGELEQTAKQTNQRLGRQRRVRKDVRPPAATSLAGRRFPRSSRALPNR